MMSLGHALLLVVALLMCADKGLTSSCNGPQWQRFVDQSSVGASKHSGPTSVKECLNYCVQTTGCVAVDVEVNNFPPGCWPHFDASSLLDSNTFHLSGTNQYRLVDRCPNATAASCNQSEWERYVGYTALGATEFAGPRTIRQCLDYCERTPSCVGVDIDANIIPLRCWPHLSAANLRPDNVYRQQNTSHYRLVGRCPNATRTAGCYNPEWEIHENQNSVGASRYKAAQSVHECLDYCGSQSSCVAVDVDLTQQPPTCWPHFSADDLLDRNVYTQPGTNQYRLKERCVNSTAAEGCRKSVWKLQRGRTALGGTLYVGPRTIQQCLDYCNATASCVAVDVDVNLVPLRCWTHVSADDLHPDNIYTQPGTHHYQLVSRCPNASPASACYNPEWEVHEDQNSAGARQHRSSESVQECLDYCGSQSNCVAVDVDLTQEPPTCWPHFSADDLLDRNVYSQPGTNQYRLTDRCADGPITGTTTPNTASTTLGPNCRQSEWKRRAGHTALGGTQHVGPRTIQQCLDYCNATASCVAVDVDVNVVPLRCWTHVSADDLHPDNIYNQPGTDHYQLISRCPNARRATDCYNPEWEVHEDQNSVGARQYAAAESVHECLDYCGSQSNCVAVDVDLTQQPPTCWPHFSADDLLDRNVYSQPGTNQYRLKDSCADGPVTESATSASTSTTT